MQRVEVGDKLKTQYMNYKESGDINRRLYIKNNGPHILVNQISYADRNDSFIVFESGAVYPAYETKTQANKNENGEDKVYYFIDLNGQSRYINLNTEQFDLEVVEHPIIEGDFKEWYVYGEKQTRFGLDAAGQVVTY